jgi:hypothetical protein
MGAMLPLPRTLSNFSASDCNAQQQVTARVILGVYVGKCNLHPGEVLGIQQSLIFMWGPYAALRYLNKPVDLILLNTGEHVLTNPAVRLASQGGSVDWLRFWFQNYGDPDPSKAAQYQRWRSLRALRDAEATAERSARRAAPGR